MDTIMRYLRAFYPSEDDYYFKAKKTDRIALASVTIFCGSNGSGKTSVINAIAGCVDSAVTRLYDPYECLSDECPNYNRENIVLETDENNKEVIPKNAIILKNINFFCDYDLMDMETPDSELVLAEMRDFSEYDLCFLDCPETLLSIDRQKELVKRIEQDSYLNRTQFIISTSSPIIASIKEAVIYDLDIVPIKPTAWKDLNIVRHYYNFFANNQ